MAAGTAQRSYPQEDVAAFRHRSPGQRHHDPMRCEWCCTRLQAQGKTSWLLIWDNASWHASKQVRTWIREHNSQIKQESTGVRILPFFLPTKSPWLNPIEPKWVHAKKAIVEPDGLLSAQQLAERICAHFGCSHEPHLSLSEKVV